MRELLTDSQLDKLADIMIAAGQVFFASIVVPFFFGLDNINPDLIPSGVALTLSAWLLSIFIIKRVSKKWLLIQKISSEEWDFSISLVLFFF